MENGAKKAQKKDRLASDLPGGHKGGLSATRANLLGGYRRDEDGEMVGLRGWMRENWRKSWWRERERGIEGLVFDVVGEVGDYAYVFDKGSVLVAVFDGELAL